MKLSHFTIAFAAIVLSSTARSGEQTSDFKPIVSPPKQDGWQFSLALPAWATWVQGETGLNGHTTDLDLGPDDIIPRIDMAADVRAEAHHGRFSVMGELLYLGVSDGADAHTIVKKVDLRVDQTMADLGMGWRIIDHPKGFVDLTGGVRYMNLYQRLTVQSDDQRIDAIAGKLALAGTASRALLARDLTVLSGRDPGVPIAPLASSETKRILRAVDRVQGNAEERKQKIAALLQRALNRTISRTDDWWDPYIGLRGRYNLNDRFYLSAKGDIGGFGVGSTLSWQAEAAVGVMVTPNIFSEIGYRALGVDYDHDGLTLNTVTHGPQMTLGINF